MTTEYRPIACAAYDEIEVLAMHRARVAVISLDENGAEISHSGQVVDTAIHHGAEFLVLLEEGDRHELRLDRILRIDDKVTGNSWRQDSD